jgi:hypothetical protein
MLFERTGQPLKKASTPLSDVMRNNLRPGARPISIWQPRVEAGELYFVRPAPEAFGDHYAVRERIPAQREKNQRRICFFGESVAAGYLYAPRLTPAGLLALQLAEITADGNYEIVDLARTNETLASLVDTIDAAMQLKPDLVVIFGGNNWNLLETPEMSPFFPSAGGRKRYGMALKKGLRDGGLTGVVEMAARERLEKAGEALTRIAELTNGAGIPVILVIPEVNLADWEVRQPVTWLPGDGTPHWYRLCWQALRALRGGQWEKAFSIADQMLALDRGLNPTTFRILAEVHRALGHSKRARLACRAEVDSDHYATLCFLSAPRATSMDQEIQRRAAAHHGFTMVDLPDIFDRYSGGKLPGRRLFLDYCHLTAEGIRVAMAAVTAAVLSLVNEEAVLLSWEELVERLPAVHLAPEVEATAYFGAAIHTAHRLLPLTSDRTMLDYWCRMALDASPGVETAMLDLVAARCAPGPAVLTSAQQRNYASPYRLEFQHGWRYDHLDLVLIEAICQALEDAGSTGPASIRRMLLAKLAVGPKATDLINPPGYLMEPLARFYPETVTFADLSERATLRCPWPETVLGFVTHGDQDVVIEVSARLPAIEGFDEQAGRVLAVSVNGRVSETTPVGARWRVFRWPVASTALRSGINRLSLEWPALPPAGTEMMEAAISRLLEGREADIHPVFGELFSVRIALA